MTNKAYVSQTYPGLIVSTKKMFGAPAEYSEGIWIFAIPITILGGIECLRWHNP